MSYWGGFTPARRRDLAAPLVLGGFGALAWAGYTGRVAPILAALGVLALSGFAWWVEGR